MKLSKEACYIFVGYLIIFSISSVIVTVISMEHIQWPKRSVLFMILIIISIMTLVTTFFHLLVLKKGKSGKQLYKDLVPCDKEDNTITTESQMAFGDVAHATKKKVNVDFDIKDSHGRTWHVKGWGDFSLSGVNAYDIDITDPNGNTTHFEGSVKSLPSGGYSVSGILTDEKGNVITITKDIEQFLIELTEYVKANL